MEIILSTNQKVIIKKELGWWDCEDLKAQWKSIGKFENIKNDNTTMSVQADNIKQITYRLWELSIEKIVDGEKEIPFSEQWLRTLSKSDGDKINEEVDKLAEGVMDSKKK